MSAAPAPRRGTSIEADLVGLALLLEGDGFEALADVVSPDDFSDLNLRRAWSAILALHRGGRAVNISTVAASSGLSPLFVAALPRDVPLDVPLADLAAEVRRRALLRRAVADLRVVGRAVEAVAAGQVTGAAEALAVLGRAYDALAAAVAGRSADGYARVWSLPEVLALEPPVARWAVAGLLRAPGLTLLYGPAGVGKTMLAVEIALAVAAGVPLWRKFDVAQAPVLILEADMTPVGFAERLRAMRPDPSLPVAVTFEPVRLDDPGAVNWLVRRPEKVIVVDPFVRVHGAQEDRADSMAAVFERAFRPLIAAGKTVLVLHHSRKPQAGEDADPLDLARGSSDLVAQADAALYMHRAPDGRVVVRCTKSRYAAPTPPFYISVREDHDGLRVHYQGGVEDERAERLRTTADLILEALGERALGADDLEREVGVRRDALRRALRALEEQGRVQRVPFGRRLLWSANGHTVPAALDGRDGEGGDDGTVA